MADDSKKIIDSLEKPESNLNKSKSTLSEWLDEVGYQIELLGEQKNLWNELDKHGGVPAQVAVSGYNTAQSLAQNSQQIVDYTENNPLRQSIYTASAIGESIAGIAISGATLSYPPDKLPQAYFHLDKVLSQRNSQSDVSQKLHSIDSSLGIEYDNAWRSLHSTTKDEARSPMFLMREVVNRLYHHYAPDDKVKAHLGLGEDEKIERKHRIEYIASCVDSWEKSTFLKEEKAFLDIYGELSSAHKHGTLDLSKTKGFLYQANGLIKLLVELL
jgi:hypothetical protein